MKDRFHTPGVLAVRLGVRADQLTRLIKRNLVPFVRAGRLHLIAEEDVPKVRAALLAAGYIRDQQAEVAHV